MEMALFSVLLFFIVHITYSNAGIISSSGLQRVNVWWSHTFQWTVDETIVSYNIYNQTTGSQTPLSSSANYSKVDGVISLTISNIQLWDAGNYSLLVTTDKSTYVDSTACLFVYGFYFQGSVNLTFGTITATEGDTVELTCYLTSTSLPAVFRSGIYYAWGISKYGIFQNISSGPAMLLNGDLVPGYTIKNNGRTLLISSVRYPDDQTILCYGSEDTLNNGWKFFSYYFQLRYRPQVSRLNPVSKKFIAIVSDMVALSLYVDANPPITSTNWTFVNSAGISQDLPPDSVANYSLNYQSLRFILMSVGFYGSYSITHSNAVGSITTTFKVHPQGPPDAPSNLLLFYFSHCEVSFQWNLMWSNTVAGQQTVVMRLRLSDTNAEVQTLNSSFDYESFNSTTTSVFTINIQPLANYTVSVWSVNSFGSSEVVEMKVRTRGQSKLSVSPQMISINGTQAIINFTVELGENAENISAVYAQCCSELSGQCASLFYIQYTINQIGVSNIPTGTDYYIDVTIYSGIYEKYNYYSDTVKGVKVSRSGNLPPSDREDKQCPPVAVTSPDMVTGVKVSRAETAANDCDDRQSSPVAVIVLACLLGVAVVD